MLLVVAAGVQSATATVVDDVGAKTRRRPRQSWVESVRGKIGDQPADHRAGTEGSEKPTQRSPHAHEGDDNTSKKKGGRRKCSVGSRQRGAARHWSYN